MAMDPDFKERLDNRTLQIRMIVEKHRIWKLNHPNPEKENAKYVL